MNNTPNPERRQSMRRASLRSTKRDFNFNGYNHDGPQMYGDFEMPVAYPSTNNGGKRAGRDFEISNRFLSSIRSNRNKESMND